MRDDSHGPPLRILVVEDDYLVAKAMGIALRQLECEVIGPVSSAKEACALIKTENVDAAILDVRLTEGTSAPTARALQYRRCPFIFVTGYSSVDVLPDDLRGYRILHKPVDLETLRSAVMELAANVSRN